MALYALKRIADNSIVRVQEFSSVPPALPAAKGLVWVSHTITPPVPSPEQVARQAALDQLRTDKTNVLAYNKLIALSNMTPAQIQAWVDANVTNLATAQDAIKTLAIGLSVLIRRERLAEGL